MMLCRIISFKRCAFLSPPAAGGDGLKHNVEVPLGRAEGGRLPRGVLLGGAHQQRPVGRHGHQDDPHRQEHALAHCVQGYFGGAVAERVPGGSAGGVQGLGMEGKKLGRVRSINIPSFVQQHFG